MQSLGKADSPSAPLNSRWFNKHVKWFATKARKKWFAVLSENFWKPVPLCLPGYVQWATGPRAAQSREFYKNRAGAPKSLPKSCGPPILRECSWVSVTSSQGFLCGADTVFKLCYFLQVLKQNLQGPCTMWKCRVSCSKLMKISEQWLQSIKPRVGPFTARVPERDYESHIREASSGYFLYWFLSRKVLCLVTSITLYQWYPSHPQGQSCWGPFSSVLFSCSVMSNSLPSRGLQHARLPCPSLTPGACSNSCRSSRWCHPAISSSVVPFSSCLQSFPASSSFLRS